MLKILNWLKSHSKNKQYIKPQKFVELKRSNSTVKFIDAGHPLYDSIVIEEEDNIRLLAPNDAAYNEHSLVHNFVAIVTYNELTYLIINSFKHFKEQSIGGLLQFDETLYEVIPFFEDEDEYQTANSYIFRETYEYDHPVENYAFTSTHNNKTLKIAIERGKQPVTVRMIDEKRTLFTQKFPQEQIELIDYIIIPALDAYVSQQEKHQSKVS